ncbi:uncharacterized protein TNCV_4306081 [Trichonephila clavipes]|nr:uncharacterized protein TNCV_4306081 [Trichonephila clavipes]
MARIVRHNDESGREGYIRNSGKEVKLFTSTLKAFQCNNRIVMAQRKHLDDFYVVELLDEWNVDVPSWKYPRNLESPRVSSPDFGNDSKMMEKGYSLTHDDISGTFSLTDWKFGKHVSFDEKSSAKNGVYVDRFPKGFEGVIKV